MNGRFDTATKKRALDWKNLTDLKLDLDGSLCEGLTDVDYTLWKTQEATPPQRL